MKLTFKKEYPDCAGQYLIHWKRGEFEVISVYFQHKRYEFGVEWEAGLFYERRHISRLNLDMMHGIAKLSD